ncbi:alpha/beta hydrolase [Nonlabens antarcticus]|uniref:alpha/beta hydrolase n=1 Tax=Nonlabens antarcticus TaxID=392714 RepID=UPI001891C308|nr:alpha/beta hydrolase [Nonlabens antarcticus]
MKINFKINFLILFSCISCKPSTAQQIKEAASEAASNDKYIFFLHNAFLETNDLDAVHPDYGRVEYKEVIQKFRDHGFAIISEKRNGNVNALEYAQEVNRQVDSLIDLGIDPDRITVVGTSKGGYIAQYISTIANNPQLNFVFIGSFRETCLSCLGRQGDMEQIPEINWCGNILNIYDRSDPAGNSALSRKIASSCGIKHYKDLELVTGLRHGFLFQALDEWMVPAMQWADGKYE